MTIPGCILRWFRLLPALFFALALQAQPAAPANLTASDLSATTVTLSWSAPTGSPVSYEIFANGLSKGTSSGTTATITGLSELTVYSFSVKARNAAGDWSPASAAKVVKTWQRLHASSGAISGYWEWSEEEERDIWIGSWDGFPTNLISASGTVRFFTTGTTNTLGSIYSPGNPPFYAESGSGGQGSNFVVTASATAGRTYYFGLGGEGDGSTGSYQAFIDFKLPVVLAPSFVASPLSGRAPLAVVFDGIGSTATNGHIVNWAWDFMNSGTTSATGATTTNTYQNSGSSVTAVTAKLTITDVDGATSQTTRAITVYPAASKAVGVEGGTTTLPFAMSGATVTLQANAPATGFQFDRWTIVSGSGTLSSATSASTTFTVGSADVVLRADYVADATAPTIPLGLTITELGATTASISWGASGDNVAVTAYEVFVNGVSKGTVSGTTATITGLSELNVYQFTVRARDAAGNWSALSAPQSARTWQRLVAAAGTITGQWEWDEEEQKDEWYGSSDGIPISVPVAGTLRMFTTGLLNTYGSIAPGPGSGSGGSGGNMLLVTQVTAGSFYVNVSGEGDGAAGSYQVFVDFKPTVTATFAASPTSGRAPLTVNFDATNSSDPAFPPSTIAWDFENDSTTDASTLVTSRTYANNGTSAVSFTAKLTVAASSGPTATATRNILVYPADSRSVLVQGGTTSLPFQMAGGTVTLTASEISVFNIFSGWTLVSGTGSFANASATTTTFTVGAADSVVRANYTLNTAPSHVTTFSTPGSFSYAIPPGATSITVKAWGAGGGMSYSSGGAGAFGSASFAPSPGQSVGVTVGAGGSGGYASSGSPASHYSGSAGGSSVVMVGQSVISAGGGGGGGTTANTAGAVGVATAAGTVGTPVLLSGTGSTPPNMADAAYPGGYVAYGSGAINYGYSNWNGSEWYQYGAPGWRGHVVITAYATSIPSINSVLVATATRGAAFSYTISASGTPTNYSATGLPYGLVVNATTGSISGTTNQVGTFNVVIGATNIAGTGTATFVLTINPPLPTITSGIAAVGTSGVEFNYSIQATESPTGYSVVGTLPTGLLLNATTGLVSGVPTQYGTFNLTARATNSGGTGTAPLTLTIYPPLPVITSAATSTATVGTSFSYAITATNAPVSYWVVSALPAGLTINASTGVISGTPTVAGSFSLVLHASNATGSGGAILELTVGGPPVIRNRPTISGIVGIAFSYRIAATNAPTSYGVTGTLPTGLSLNTTTGVLGGTPTASGTFSITLSATNAYGTASASVSLTILADTDGDGIPDQVESLLGSNQGAAGTTDSSNQTLQFKVQRPAQ